jgi:hypothetical protein
MQDQKKGLIEKKKNFKRRFFKNHLPLTIRSGYSPLKRGRLSFKKEEKVRII